MALTKAPTGLLYELHYVLAFVAVVEEGGFTNASDRLHVAQPSISRKIKRLEQLLGAELFVRRPHSYVQLTPAGIRFLKECRRILKEIDRSIDSIR